MVEPTESGQDSFSVANELIKARSERGFSQAHLAELSGVSRSAIKAYETGRNMPGSRELRALCAALKVTPNRMLFGTEAPTFGEQDADRIDAVLRSDPESKAVARSRLVVLSELLTTEETGALITLAQSIAVARHGSEKVKQATFAAVALTGVARTFAEQVSSAERSGKPIDAEAGAGNFDEFLRRQGMVPPDKSNG